MLLADAVESWLRQLAISPSSRGTAYSRHTTEGYARHARAFAAAVGPLHVGSLTHELLTAHLAGTRAAGMKPTHYQTRDKVVRLFARWLAERGMVTADPLAGTQRIRQSDPPVSRLDDTEVRRILAACALGRWDGLRNAAIITTLWQAGVRAEECVNLDVADYQPGPRLLTVRNGKGGKPRLLGVSDELAAALDEWIVQARGDEPGPLFPSERGTRLLRRSLSRLVRTTGAAAGVAVYPHQLRHTFACNFIRAGGDLHTLSRLLGHTTLAMTIRYLRAVDEEEAAARHAAVMNAAAAARTTATPRLAPRRI